jgi:hypothetical protein
VRKFYTDQDVRDAIKENIDNLRKRIIELAEKENGSLTELEKDRLRHLEGNFDR